MMNRFSNNLLGLAICLALIACAPAMQSTRRSAPVSNALHEEPKKPTVELIVGTGYVSIADIGLGLIFDSYSAFAAVDFFGPFGDEDEMSARYRLGLHLEPFDTDPITAFWDISLGSGFDSKVCGLPGDDYACQRGPILFAQTGIGVAALLAQYLQLRLSVTGDFSWWLPHDDPVLAYAPNGANSESDDDRSDTSFWPGVRLQCVFRF